MKNKDGVLPRVLIDLENKRLVVRSPVLGRFTLNFGNLFQLVKDRKHGQKDGAQTNDPKEGEKG